MRAQILALIVGIVAVLPQNVQATSEDLGEASGLPEMAVKDVEPHSTTTFFRGYLKGRYDLLSVSKDRKEAVGAEASLETKVPIYAESELFGDLRATYYESTHHGLLRVNQFGVRKRFGERWLLALGKERNRRSPGLIISPSDVLHGRQSLPGLDEDRSGVWLARASWMTQKQSFDLILLPVDRVNDQGMPREDASTLGFMARSFHQFAHVDMQLDIGTLDEAKVFGFSAQTFIKSVWKLYGEAGYREKEITFNFPRKDTWSYLTGAGYEGSSLWTVRTEYYHNDAGLSDDEARIITRMKPFGEAKNRSVDLNANALNPFVRKNYLLASLNFIELADRWNVTQSLIHDLDGDDTLSLSRVTLLATDRSEMGLSVLSVHKKSELSSILYPFDWMASIDWKWSF